MILAEFSTVDWVVQGTAIFSVFLACGLPVALAFIGWLVGTTVENSHMRRLDEMERQVLTIPITDMAQVPRGMEPSGAVMVVGSVVLATDHFRTLLATLRKIIGGEIAIYQRLLTRARREAICRMMAQAHQCGATAVINLRVETSTIGVNSGRGGAMAEVIAYGTALMQGDRAGARS